MSTSYRTTYTVVISEAQRRILQAVCAEASDDLVDRLGRQDPALRDTDGELTDANEEVELLRGMFADLDAHSTNDFTA